MFLEEHPYKNHTRDWDPRAPLMAGYHYKRIPTVTKKI